MIQTEDDGTIRQFDTGATRNSGKDKLEPQGFISPEVLYRFSQYMHEHRVQADGALRDPDNWKKGIPQEEYIKSLIRHVMDFWALMKGQGRALYDEKVQDPEEIACAIMFNVQGWLHEELKKPKLQTYNMLKFCGGCGKEFQPGLMALYCNGMYYCNNGCKP